MVVHYLLNAPRIYLPESRVGVPVLFTIKAVVIIGTEILEAVVVEALTEYEGQVPLGYGRGTCGIPTT